MVWHEGNSRSSPNNDNSLVPRPLSLRKWPDFFQFKSLVEEFSSRWLTYLCDSVDAFAGITRILEPSFPGGFHFGLPELFFDVALLWRMLPAAVDRVDSAIKQSKPTADLPSWSWVRWLSLMDLWAWDSANDHLFLSYYNQNRCVISPIVEWFKIHQQSGERKLIASNYRVHRNCVFSPSSTLAPTPETWQRRESEWKHQNLAWEREDKGNPDEFTHPAVGDYPRFRYPIPIPSEPGFVADSGPWKPEICGVVECASLGMERIKFGYFKLMTVQRAGQEPVQVGVADIHDATGDVERERTSIVYAGINFEFIAISKGEYSAAQYEAVGVPLDYFDSWERAHMSRGGNLYKFYNIMLILRMGRFAERRGIGRVEASCWEALDRSRIEITLR
jgi:hypothetical protein